jgi:Heavy metal binding domain
MSSSQPQQGTTYTCPMHHEIQRNQPGDCPTCGMHLVPTTEQHPAQTYSCPMHPEIRRNQPGDCPTCGMHLVPVQD